VRNYHQVCTRVFSLLLQLFPLSILKPNSRRPDLRQLRSEDLFLYLPGFKLGFAALATSF
jgi:hypothetical protein